MTGPYIYIYNSHYVISVLYIYPKSYICVYSHTLQLLSDYCVGGKGGTGREEQRGGEADKEWWMPDNEC